MNQFRDKIIKYYERWSRPNIILRNSFVYLIFWLIAGGFYEKQIYDSQNSSSTIETADGSLLEVTIHWYNDYFGHWIITFAVVVSILLKYAHTQISISASEKLRERIREQIDYRIFFRGTLIFLICFLLATGNMFVVSSPDLAAEEVIIYWQYSVAQWYFPGLVAYSFYLLVMFPLFLNIYRFCFSLNMVAKHSNEMLNFNVRNPNGMFGLDAYGQLIFTTLALFFVATFPLLTIQMLQKNQEVTVGSIAGAVIALSLVYYVAVKPLMTIYGKLLEEKIKFNNSNIELRASLEEKLKRLADSNEQDDYQLDVTMARLEETNRNIELGKNLKAMPVSIKSKLSVAISAIPTLSGIVFKIIDLVSGK